MGWISQFLFLAGTSATVGGPWVSEERGSRGSFQTSGGAVERAVAGGFRYVFGMVDFFAKRCCTRLRILMEFVLPDTIYSLE